MKLNIFLALVGLIGLIAVSTLAPAYEGMEAVSAAKQVVRGGFENYVQARAEMAFWAKFGFFLKLGFGMLFGWNVGVAFAKYLNKRDRAKIISMAKAKETP